MSDFSSPADYEDSFEQGDGQDPGSDHKRDLAAYVKHNLDQARLNQMIRFAPEDCESPLSFLAALQPGDVLTVNSERALILEVQGTESRKDMICLVKPDPRDARSAGIAIKRVSLSERNVEAVKEVVASRNTLSEELLQAVHDPIVRENMRVFMHEGKAGSQFRNASMGGGKQRIQIGIEPQTGQVLSVQPDFDAIDAIITTNGFFQPNLPYIEKISFNSEMSELAETRLFDSIQLANWLMKVERVNLVSSIL